jgi:hypothetical protein
MRSPARIDSQMNVFDIRISAYYHRDATTDQKNKNRAVSSQARQNPRYGGMKG